MRIVLFAIYDTQLSSVYWLQSRYISDDQLIEKCTKVYVTAAADSFVMTLL